VPAITPQNAEETATPIVPKKLPGTGGGRGQESHGALGRLFFLLVFASIVACAGRATIARRGAGIDR
jgi:hypothetical protein